MCHMVGQILLSCHVTCGGSYPPPLPTMQQGPLASPVMEQSLVICPVGGKVLPHVVWWGKVCAHAL